VALVVGPRVEGLKLLHRIGEALGVPPKSLTALALGGADGPVASESALITALGGHPLLYDLEAICWRPWLRLDPMRLLRTVARREGVVALWPGVLNGRLLSYSAPGRADHVQADAAGLTVLRPRSVRFPDEVPFTVERIPG
jgi:hypothetical protein